MIPYFNNSNKSKVLTSITSISNENSLIRLPIESYYRDQSKRLIAKANTASHHVISAQVIEMQLRDSKKRR